MLDVINYFSPYKEDRFFHLIPFVGVGVGYKHQAEVLGVKDNSHRFGPQADAGLQLKFRLARFVDFTSKVRSRLPTCVSPLRVKLV